MPCTFGRIYLQLIVSYGICLEAFTVTTVKSCGVCIQHFLDHLFHCRPFRQVSSDRAPHNFSNTIVFARVTGCSKLKTLMTIHTVKAVISGTDDQDIF